LLITIHSTNKSECISINKYLSGYAATTGGFTN
jgi:hypothetical protein